eukprot:s17_g22.t1
MPGSRTIEEADSLLADGPTVSHTSSRHWRFHGAALIAGLCMLAALVYAARRPSFSAPERGQAPRPAEPQVKQLNLDAVGGVLVAGQQPPPTILTANAAAPTLLQADPPNSLLKKAAAMEKTNPAGPSPLEKEYDLAQQANPKEKEASEQKKAPGPPDAGPLKKKDAEETKNKSCKTATPGDTCYKAVLWAKWAETIDTPVIVWKPHVDSTIESAQDVPRGVGDVVPDLSDLLGAGTESSIHLDGAEREEEFYDPGEETEVDDTIEESRLRTFSGNEEARHRRFIFEQSVNFLPATMPLLPWEQGVFAEIFAGSSNLGLPDDRTWTPRFAPPLLPPLDPAVDPVTEAAGSTPLSGLPVFAKHAKALEDREFLEQLGLEWTKAQACWLGILEGCGFDGLVGNYVGESLQNLDRERAMLHIRDACGVRSPKTVLKRGRDLLLFIKWAERREIPWWPLREVTILDYLTEVEKAEKSKFIGKNLVKRLEILCKTSPSVYDRYFIGCLLFACYSRARWSDLAHMQSFFYDTIEKEGTSYGYVEARTRVHKTSTSEERKAMYMPFVAPIQGLESFCWALEWKDALVELGLITGLEPLSGTNCIGRIHQKAADQC